MYFVFCNMLKNIGHDNKTLKLLLLYRDNVTDPPQ